jgi:hypothetical protein
MYQEPEQRRFQKRRWFEQVHDACHARHSKPPIGGFVLRSLEVLATRVLACRAERGTPAFPQSTPLERRLLPLPGTR